MDGTRQRSRFALRLRVASYLAVICSLGALGIVRAAGVPVGSTAASPAESTRPEYALYVAGGLGGPAAPSLVRIDPVTLLDSADHAPAPFARLEAPSAGHDLEWFASGDGGTVLAVENPPAVGGWLNSSDVTYTIFDAASGAVRARFHPPAWVQTPPLVSGDGTRLLVTGVARPPSDVPNACWGGSCLAKSWPFERRGPAPQQDPRERLRWYLVDTRDGRLVATMPVPVAAAGPWLDPAGSRLYVLSASVDTLGVGVGPATVTGFDLESGTETGRDVLPDLLLGLHVEGGQVRNDLPGVALSPDGRRLAVVHPDLAAITLIDAERMEIERAVAVHGRESIAARVLAWLGLAPAEVAAKGEPGTTISAVFAADGRSLYVFGYTSTDYEEGQTLGLRTIDVATGEIVAESKDLATGAEPLAVRPAPDGRSVYVVRATGDGGDALLRLDALTLDLGAQRLFSEDRQVILVSNETPVRT
jgi:hypothetical protein